MHPCSCWVMQGLAPQVLAWEASSVCRLQCWQHWLWLWEAFAPSEELRVWQDTTCINPSVLGSSKLSRLYTCRHRGVAEKGLEECFWWLP